MVRASAGFRLEERRGAVSRLGIFGLSDDSNFSIQLDAESISFDMFRVVGHGDKLEDTTDGVVS